MATKTSEKFKKTATIKDIKPKKDPKGGSAINPQPLPPSARPK